MKTRTEIIQALIDHIGATMYLEIGVSDGGNYRAIRCDNKVGVDPHPHRLHRPTHQMTSDDFFTANSQKWDVIFIDGMHEATQAARDIRNAIACLNKGGAVVVHDVMPHAEWLTRPFSQYRTGEMWTGNVWQAFLYIAAEGKYKAQVLDTDFGVGVIYPDEKGTPLALPDKLEYKYDFELMKAYVVDTLALPKGDKPKAEPPKSPERVEFPDDVAEPQPANEEAKKKGPRKRKGIDI